MRLLCCGLPAPACLLFFALRFVTICHLNGCFSPLSLYRCPRPRPRTSQAWTRCWLRRLRLRSRPRWCRRWRSRRAVGRKRARWAVQGEQAPGSGFFVTGLGCVFTPLRIFSRLSVCFGCMVADLYKDIQYTLSLYPVCTRLLNTPSLSRPLLSTVFRFATCNCLSINGCKCLSKLAEYDSLSRPGSSPLPAARLLTWPLSPPPPPPRTRRAQPAGQRTARGTSATARPSATDPIQADLHPTCLCSHCTVHYHKATTHSRNILNPVPL
jgi:hypothetical protein